MRYEFEKILGEELRYLAIATRDRLGITQKEMGIRLHMSENSYSDIETGRTSCGALTQALLLSMQDNPKYFLDHVTRKFTQRYEGDMQAV